MFALVDNNRVTLPGRHARKFKTSRPCTDYQYALPVERPPSGACTPNTLSSDNRIIGALHTTTANHRSPTIVSSDAPSNVPFSSLFDLCQPLLVGNHLARKQNSIRIARRNQVFCHVRVANPSDHQDWLCRNCFES